MAPLALSRKFAVPALIATIALLAGTRHPRASAASPRADGGEPGTLRVPAVFVENIGQFDPAVRLYSRGAGHAIFATDNGVTIAFSKPNGRGLALRLAFVGESGGVHVAGEDEQAGRVNYLTGRDPHAWRTGARTFGRATYVNVWRGVDATVQLGPHHLTYDFRVAPGADPSSIRLRYDGARGVRISDTGELTIETGDGALADRAPRAFQTIGGRRVPVASAFVLRDHGEYGIRVGAYDRSQPLEIDPTLVYASYLGSSGADEGHAIAIDSQDNAYVTGFTQWIDFPTTTGAYQTILGGNDTNTPKRDVFVSKINPTASVLVYSTYLGGSNDDEGNAIAVDGSGSAYVTGYTRSADFPITAGAVMTTVPAQPSTFVTKLNATGSGLVYSTFYGGIAGKGIAVDASGRAYVVGQVETATLPAPVNGFQTTFANGFSDGFLARLSAAGNAVEYATYLGGSGWDLATAVAVNGTDAFVTGDAVSFDFPTTAGAFDPNGELMPRTSDGGTTWTIARGVKASAVQSLAVDPTSRSTVYAGTDGQGIFKSTDGGVSFAPSGSGIPAGVNVNSLAIVPSAPSTIYAATSSGVYKSLDGGASWSSNGPNDRFLDIAVNASATSVFAVTQSAVYRSTDGGASWTIVLTDPNTNPGWSVLTDPANAGTVYVGTYGFGIFKSTDGGTTWANLQTGVVGIVYRLRTEPTGAIDAAAGSGVFRSTNGGASFTALPGFSNAGPVGDVAFDVSTTPATIYAMPFSRGLDQEPLWKSTDGGTTATRLLPAGTEPIPNAIVVIDASTLLVGVNRSADAFVTRIATSSTGPASLVYSTYLSGVADDVGNGIAVDTSGAAYVAGITSSPDFPHTAGAPVAPLPQPLSQAGWAVKLNASGSALTYAAGFAPSANAIAIDAGGAAYVAAGQTVGRLSPDGTAYNAYQFGGSSVPSARGVAAGGSSSSAYVAGITSATDFPTTSGVFQPSFGSGASDVFVAKVSFADVAGGGTTGGPLPSPWASQDIGTTGLPGSASYSNGVFSVTGAGADIWGTSDSFQYVYQPLSGDGTLTVRVTGEQNTNTFAKAGIMMRQALGSSSAHVLLDVRPNGSLEFMYRYSAGGTTTFVTGGSQPFPAWLRLVRTISTITASVSADGTNWTTLGNVNTAMTGQIDVGLAVTSHDTSVTNTATFDNVTLTEPSGRGGTGALPAPWTAAAVGTVGTSGSASFANGTFTIAGAGSDIWGTSDSFEYVYQPLGGDGTIVARVTGEQNTSAYAKAGVMMRETLDAGSAHVLLDIKPNGGIEFMTRQTAGGSTTFLAGSSMSFPTWLKLARSGSTITASLSSDGTAWTVLGSTSTAMGASIDVGLAVTSHDTSVTNTATFDNVSATTPSSGGGTAGLPSPWVSNDVGSVGLAGSTTYNSGTFTVQGSGADIWGTADAFQYASQTMGNGQIVARVTAEQDTSPYAKAGVMLRETMAANSAHVMLDVKPGGGIEFMTRSATDASTTFIAGGSIAFPAWLKLVRSGSTVTGYVSSDGTTWTTIGSTTTSMAATANIGLLVTSHDNTVLNTSTFDNVTVTPGP